MSLWKLIIQSHSQEIKALVITTMSLGPVDSKRTSPNDIKVQWATLQRRKNARKGELHGKVILLVVTQTKPAKGENIVPENKNKKTQKKNTSIWKKD